MGDLPHRDDCAYLRPATCAIAIACEHGYDVCPICDPCTCFATKPASEGPAWEVIRDA